MMSFSRKTETFVHDSNPEHAKIERKAAQQLAKQFCELSDEGQAQMFIEAVRIAGDWKRDQATQWFDVGLHLATCECSCEQARRMLNAIVKGIQVGNIDVREIALT